MSTKTPTSSTPKSLPIRDQAPYRARPRRKPDNTTKGKLNEWDNGYKEFIPAGTKESNRRMFKQMGNSSFYKSEGEKESSYSCHLNVDGKSSDPVAEMLEQFFYLTSDERKESPKLPENSQGRMLFEDGDKRIQIWLDSEKGEVCIMTRLVCSPDIERQLLQAQADMGRVVGRHRQEIINLNNKIYGEL